MLLHKCLYFTLGYDTNVLYTGFVRVISISVCFALYLNLYVVYERRILEMGITMLFFHEWEYKRVKSLFCLML